MVTASRKHVQKVLEPLLLQGEVLRHWAFAQTKWKPKLWVLFLFPVVFILMILVGVFAMRTAMAVGHLGSGTAISVGILFTFTLFSPYFYILFIKSVTEYGVGLTAQRLLVVKLGPRSSPMQYSLSDLTPFTFSESTRVGLALAPQLIIQYPEVVIKMVFLGFKGNRDAGIAIGKVLTGKHPSTSSSASQTLLSQQSRTTSGQSSLSSLNTAKPISPRPQNETAISNQTSGSPFREKDNIGTRHDSKGISLGYWMGERMNSLRKDPFVMFTFRKAEDARAALQELSCIHVASDSQKLICTERLIFGYYTFDDVYEAILCGDALTVELWGQAKTSFSKHGGEKKNELAPTRRAGSTPKATMGQSEKVVYIKEDRKSGMGGTAIYRVYKGPDEQSAMAFLKENPVTQNLLYLVVETPEGNFCRDTLGIYKEDA